MVYLPDYVEYQYAPPSALRKKFSMASDDAFDLLSKMFTYDPKARISVQQALEHRYVTTHSIEQFIYMYIFLGLFGSASNHCGPVRYFTSAPLPTDPDKLPRPAPKRESINSKASDFNPKEAPTVLSPPRKSRRVMPERASFEGNASQVDKVDDHVGDIRQAAGESTSRNEPVPMSVDFSIFGAKPPNRPTINR